MNDNVLAARITKSAQFLTDCSGITDAIFSGKRVSKSRVRKLRDYRLFFEAIQSDQVLKRLADYSLRLLDEIVEFIAIYNALGESEALRQKAKQIEELMQGSEEIMNEIESEVFSKWRLI
jgi:hypothetical protein